jgi:hypothetical protein
MTPEAHARVIVSRAIAEGRLRRPTTCPGCRRDTFVCAVVGNPSRPLHTITWACRRCLFAARTQQDLLPRARGAEPLAGAPIAPRVRCAGVNVRGQRCRFSGRYERPIDGAPVCAFHLPIDGTGKGRARRRSAKAGR